MRDSQTHKEWVADLRGIARECQFVCQSDECSFNYVNEIIRDQIIVHTPFDAIRTATLQKLQPSLEDVLSIAETYEATTKMDGIHSFTKQWFQLSQIGRIIRVPAVSKL